jgi:hypothetical protein
MLRVDLGDSFNFFRFFFFFLTLGLINNRLHCLLMKHVDVVNSLAKIKVELMNLLLEKINDSVALGNESIALNNLILSMLNGFNPLCNNLFLGSDSGLEFLNLRILPANLITISLGYAGQSIYHYKKMGKIRRPRTDEFVRVTDEFNLNSSVTDEYWPSPNRRRI